MTATQKILGDAAYIGLPFKAGGRDRSGVDCAGLVRLFLVEQCGVNFTAPETPLDDHGKSVVAHQYLADCRSPWVSPVRRGDVVFFSQINTGLIVHVAVAIGPDKLLNILNGCESRIDNGYTMLRRLSLVPVGVVRHTEVERLSLMLANKRLGDAGTIILLVVAIALSAASYLLAPKLAQPSRKGKYSYDGLVTQNTPEIPLPDLLGTVVVAGNSPYTQLADNTDPISDQTEQKANKIVILQSGPSELIDYVTGLMINGKTWSDPGFYDGSAVEGFTDNPEQTKAEAVTGDINGDTDVPSFTVYDGAYGITVPVDIRAHYDRSFPIYGFSGCSYFVFRLIDSTKFTQFNLTCRVKGRQCRTFTSSGFDVTTINNETITPDSTTKRFKLDHIDVKAVTSVTQGATTFTEISATNQSGDIYYLNKTKGYLEFPTAPTAGTDIEVDYTYYPRAWTENPATQMVYLLTDSLRGKGFAESRVDFDSAVALRDYCDEIVAYNSSIGMIIGERFKSNYVLDTRKAIQEHLQALLDSCYAYLFLSQGKCVMKPRRDAASVFSFNTTNIAIEGQTPGSRSTFVSEDVDRTERPNRVKVLFHSDDTYNAETSVIVDDQADQRGREPRIGNGGVVETNLKFPAVTDQVQAERLAGIILREHLGSMRTAEWKTNVKGLALEPGDIVDVTHPSQPTWAAKLFRIEELSHDDLDRLTIQASEYAAETYL